MQTEKGYDKLAQIVKSSDKPRSYIVRANGKHYQRNRRHLLPVKEPKPSENITPMTKAQQAMTTPAEVTTPVLNRQAPPSPANTVPVPPSPARFADPQAVTSPPTPRRIFPPSPAPASSVVTRSGRVSKPNSKYADYEK